MKTGSHGNPIPSHGMGWDGINISQRIIPCHNLYTFFCCIRLLFCIRRAIGASKVCVVIVWMKWHVYKNKKMCVNYKIGAFLCDIRKFWSFHGIAVGFYTVFWLSWDGMGKTDFCEKQLISHPMGWDGNGFTKAIPCPSLHCSSLYLWNLNVLCNWIYWASLF